MRLQNKLVCERIWKKPTFLSQTPGNKENFFSTPEWRPWMFRVEQQHKCLWFQPTDPIPLCLDMGTNQSCARFHFEFTDDKLFCFEDYVIKFSFMLGLKLNLFATRISVRCKATSRNLTSKFNVLIYIHIYTIR